MEYTRQQRRNIKMPEINDYVMKNLIYCEDCHSFVHRLYLKWKEGGLPEDKNKAQSDAWDIISMMNKCEESSKSIDEKGYNH